MALPQPFLGETIVDEYGDPLECLDDGRPDDPCNGTIEYRMALSATGRSFPRCEHHWETRVTREDGIRRRYPQQQPVDFDPAYAGEAW